MLTLWPRELSLRSIRGRLAVLLAIVLLPAGAIAFHSGLSALQTRHQVAQSEEGVRIAQSLSAVRDQITQMREMARSLAANADLFTTQRASCRSALIGFAAEFPQIERIAVLDESGAPRCANAATPSALQPDARSLIRRSDEMHDAIIGYIPNPAAPEQSVLAVVTPLPRTGLHGEQLFVEAARSASPLLQYAVSNVNRGGAFAVLVDRDGVVLQGERVPAAVGGGARLENALRARAPYEFESAFRVDNTWFVGTPLEEGELYMLVGWPPVPLSWIEASLAVWSLLAPILLWLGGVAAAWYAVDAFVARPLVSLERLARAYARGSETETEERELQNAPQEIASLRRTLAAMAKTLRGREAKLAEALKEERALLREINHRVKNNLQMVASILSIQGRASSDKAEARGLARAQDRVHLLAMAHTRIYESGEVRHVALDVLTQDIVRSLIASRQSHEREFVLDLALEPVRGGVDRAVPFAFLVGEVLLYILESVTPAPAAFQIAITLKSRADHKIELFIGGKEDWPVRNPTANALRMMAAFARQMDADVAYEESGIRLVWVEPGEDVEPQDD